MLSEKTRVCGSESGHRSARSFWLTVAFLCALVMFAFAARAQENTADILGTVTDSSGAAVPGATVTLTNTGTNITQTAQTNATGDFVFTLVQVGTYAVKVQANGFKTFVAPNLSVSSGDRARVDAAMEVGTLQQTVEVQATATPALQTDTSNLSALVTKQAVEDVPLNGRNITKLIQLSAGVSEGSTSGVMTGTQPDDRRPTGAFVANGQPENDNNQMVDGMDNNERIAGGNIIRPSVDAIQEISVQTNLYDASVGKTGGAIVNTITKSGTNDFHGTVYEFFRNKVLNTNPGYAFPSNSTGGLTTVPGKPPYEQNQFGASIGGPIRKDKTFFFVDYEGFRQEYGLSVPALVVPSDCEKGSVLANIQAGIAHLSNPSVACPDGQSPTASGDFSDHPTISTPGGSSNACSNAAGGNYGTAACPFVVVNPTKITTLGQALFSMYPLSNCAPVTPTCTSFTSSPIRTQRSTTIDSRIDQHFSDSNTFYARYNVSNFTTFEPPSFPNVTINPTTGFPEAAGTSGGVTLNPGAYTTANAFPGYNFTEGQAIAVSFVHVYSPALLLNLKFQYDRLALRSLPINQNSDVSNKLGFPCNTTPTSLSSAGTCINAPGLSFATGLLLVNPTGGGTTYSNLGDAPFVPLLEFDNDFQYQGALNWTKGSHSLKIGVSLIRRRASIGQTPSGNGGVLFSGDYSGEPLGDLLEGLGTGGVSEGGGPLLLRNYSLWEGGYEMWEPTTYIQDDWRAKRWLTLNLGMRYDIFTPQTERGNRITNYDQDTGVIIGPALPGSQRSGATAGVETPYRDIAPRFGFSMTMKRDFVLRGGFGLTFFPTNYDSNYDLKNPPASYNVNCTIQNEAGSNTTCQAPYASTAVAQYGLPITSSTSVVGQVGGPLLSAGIPVPVENIGSILAPSLAQCQFVTAATYATTCPAATDPYQSYTIGNTIPFDNPNEYLEQSNLQLQKAFGQNVVTIGGVSELGRHAPMTINLQALSNPSENGVLPLSYEFPWLAKTTQIVQYGTTGANSYEALQATFVRRFGKGLTAQVNYVWSHTLSYTSAGCQPTMTAAAVNKYPGGTVNVPATDNPCYYDNPKNPTSPIVVPWYNIGGFNVGNAGTQDVADRIAYTVNYQLPFGQSLTGVEAALAKGWALNAAGSWQTGLPFSVGQSLNTTGLSGAGNPDQICSGRLSSPTHLKWFNAGCFVHQYANGTFGNEHSSQLMGPDLKRFDFSIFKDFRLTERIQAQFRTEIFNLFNTPNFNTPGNTTISTFTVNGPGGVGTNVNSNPAGVPVGAITGLNPNFGSRVVQLGLKFLF